MMQQVCRHYLNRKNHKTLKLKQTPTESVNILSIDLLFTMSRMGMEESIVVWFTLLLLITILIKFEYSGSYEQSNVPKILHFHYQLCTSLIVLQLGSIYVLLNYSLLTLYSYSAT